MILEFSAEKYYHRLDHFLMDQDIPGDMSRSKMEKFIKGGDVTVNGEVVKKKNSEIKEGDTIALVLPDEEEPEEYTPSMELEKLYEDEWYLIINKPIGISVHPGAGKREETILDIFKYYYPEVEKFEDKERPGIVHRLDKDTSGILILAKTPKAQRKMQQLFKRRIVYKYYYALVEGHVKIPVGVIDEPIVRNPNNRRKFKVETNPFAEELDLKDAITEYSCMGKVDNASLMLIRIHTGRTHQIRVHFSHIGHPVLGDSLYGKAETFPRMALHATCLAFEHPYTGNLMAIRSYLPREISQVFRDKKNK